MGINSRVFGGWEEEWVQGDFAHEMVLTIGKLGESLLIVTILLPFHPNGLIRYLSPMRTYLVS